MATVLYVDDEDAIRRVVVTWLTRRGHTVHAVATVSEACDLLQSRSVDGAFVDLAALEQVQEDVQRGRPGADADGRACLDQRFRDRETKSGVIRHARDERTLAFEIDG